MSFSLFLSAKKYSCTFIAVLLIFVLILALSKATYMPKEVSLSLKANGEGFILVYMGNEESSFELELTWLKDHPQADNLGECEFHLAFETDDYEASHKLHEEMGCICYENPSMGIYFITDPDGYWLEIVPSKK